MLALAVALISFPALSPAETVNSTADLHSHPGTAAYLVSRAMLDTMYRLGLEQDRKLGLQTDCKSEYRVQPYSSLLLAPIVFPEGAPHPVQGAWFSRYRFERCGDAKLYNILFQANRNGAPPTPGTYYPGATIASPELVNDAMPAVIAGALARAGLKDCKNVTVLDMRITEPTHDVIEAGKTFRNVWSETWTFRMCGKMSDVVVSFVPDAEGGRTTFSSGPVQQGEARGE